jgi:hypothetical protein
LSEVERIAECVGGGLARRHKREIEDREWSHIRGVVL